MGDLATIQKVKQYLGTGADVDTKDDTLLTRALDAAEDMIESYCGRVFAQATRTEYYDGSGSDKLLLRQHPITLPPDSGAVTPIVLEYGEALTVGEDPVAVPDVLIVKETGLLVMTAGIWIPERRYYKITYSAGYLVVPVTIEQAAVDLACLILKEKIQVGIASKTTGQQTVNLIRTLPDYSQKALDLYRDHASVVSL